MDYKKAAAMIMRLFVLMVVSLMQARCACAAILSGYFPMHQGLYWNFSCPEETDTMSWAINGDFNLRGAGSVFMLYQGNGRVLCLKQDWEGVRVYAEITPDTLYLPDKPYLFYPRDISSEPNASIQDNVTLKIYTSPQKNEKYEQTGTETRHISFIFKSSEEIQVGAQQYPETAVIERTTHRGQDTPVRETLWLARAVGPVKITVKSGGKEKVYTIVSYAGLEKKPPAYPLSRYFPLKPGMRWTYQDQSGQQRVTEAKIPIKSKLADNMTLIPFEDYLHDVCFVMMKDAGLVMPQKYWNVNGFCQADPEQERPITLLPVELKAGTFTYSRSYTISRRWPNMSEMAISDLELVYSSVPLGIEDVTTPAGTFKGCIKIALANMARAYAVQFDVIRVGYIWLASDTGIVKEDLINMFNYTVPEMAHSIFDVRFWKLAKLETVTPTPVLSYQDAQESPPAAAAPVPAQKKKTTPWEGMTWENNSKEMYDKAVDMTPFFVRTLAKKRIMDGITAKAGEKKIVSEEIVLLSVKESAADKHTQQVLVELKKMRMQ
ncbi:MAG: hypothetical protein NTV89_19365 [Proteobacteria bacterium]|nr:hypothetical protein [Pseudomonadota bacterium]